MITDFHIQNWTDLCASSNPSFHMRWLITSRQGVLSTRSSQSVKFCMSATSSHSPFGFYAWVPYHDPGPRNDHCPCAICRAQSATIREFTTQVSLFPFSHHTMSLYIDMKIIRPWNCSGSHFISVIMFWISVRICNAVNPGKFSTRTPSAHRPLDPILCIDVNSYTNQPSPSDLWSYTILNKRRRFLQSQTEPPCQ